MQRCEVMSDAATYTAEVIAPYWLEATIGAVVLASTDPNALMGTLELKLAETAAGFSNQMEQWV